MATALTIVKDDNLDADGKVTGARGAKAYKKWVPKEWRPEYEAIVALSCTGLSNKEVGSRFGYGPQQVSNICNTPQGKKLKEIITERLRNSNLITFEERLAALGDRALKNIEDVLQSDKILEKAPLAVFDRSLTVLKLLGKVKNDAPAGMVSAAPLVGNAGKVSVMVLSNDAAKTLNEGLRKADRIAEIHNADKQR